MKKVTWLFVIKVSALLVFLALAIANSAEAAPKAVVTWSDTSTGEEFFEVQKGPALAGPFTAFAKTGPNVTSIEDTTVSVGQQVCYRVRAGAGTIVTAWSPAKCATAPNTLAVPGGLAVVIVEQ